MIRKYAVCAMVCMALWGAMLHGGANASFKVVNYPTGTLSANVPAKTRRLHNGTNGVLCVQFTRTTPGGNGNAMYKDPSSSNYPDASLHAMVLPGGYVEAPDYGSKSDAFEYYVWICNSCIDSYPTGVWVTQKPGNAVALDIAGESKNTVLIFDGDEYGFRGWDRGYEKSNLQPLRGITAALKPDNVAYFIGTNVLTFNAKFQEQQARANTTPQKKATTTKKSASTKKTTPAKKSASIGSKASKSVENKY